jgi:predicted enzyme related to lactoylglutathione lyase
MTHAINWFEIPVKNFEKAETFYNTVLGVTLKTETMNGLTMGMFPTATNGSEAVTGAIVKGEHYEPSEKGTMVYLNGGEDLQPILSRVETAGGKVIVPKMLINSEVGYIGVFRDTEGNNVALHSRH